MFCMGSGPRPGEYDEAKLLATVSAYVDEELAAARKGADTWRAHVLLRQRETAADHPNGHTASLLKHWLTGGWSDLETLEQARAVLDDPNDARRKRLVDEARQLAAGTVTWEEHARRTKKALIPHARKPVQATKTDASAIPLRSAKRALRDELTAAGLSLSAPETAGFWAVFKKFAHLLIAAPRGYVIDSDMCLAEWTAFPTSTTGAALEWSLVRQFNIVDLHGNYERMEQLQLHLRYEPEDGTHVDRTALWSGNDLDNWVSDVEKTEAFALSTKAKPLSATITHEPI